MRTYLVISWSEEEFIVEAILLGANNLLKQLIEKSAHTNQETGSKGIGRLGKLSIVYKVSPLSISDYHEILVIDDKNNGFLLVRIGEDHVKVIRTPDSFRLIKRAKDKIINIKLNV